MAEPKKLLSLRFASSTGGYEYNIGCNSSDNIPITSPPQWFISNEKPLDQVGCNFVIPYSVNYSHQDTQQIALHDALKKAGYGARNPFLPSLLAKNVPLYLNGVSNLNGVDMPYLKWVSPNSSYATVLHYFRPDGTDLGTIMYNLGTVGQSSCGWYAGQLYTDGTFRGCAGPIMHYTIPITETISHTRYKWSCTVVIDEPIEAMNPAVVDDLQEYLPIDPEGEFADEGNGDFDSTSNPIDYPDLPTLNVIDTGMTGIYEMKPEQLRSLSHYLWTTSFATTLEKMFNDPMESILNLTITPIDLTSTAVTSNIRIGNLTTTVTGQRLTEQYKIYDFGTIHLREYWANFGDYSPYTKISIFLPYVGVQSLSIDDLMNGQIKLKAYCDVLTGSIQYMLMSVQDNRAGHGHESVLYSWGGNCHYQVPLNASNMSSVITSLISTTGTIAGAVGSAVATGGMTAPIAVGTVGSAVSNIMNAKTHVQRGGGLGGSVGLFGVQYPYLILERPEQIFPENYNETIGVPCEKTDYLKNYAGFVKVKGVNLTINKASDNELNEIESLLKDGVLV